LGWMVDYGELPQLLTQPVSQSCRGILPMIKNEPLIFFFADQVPPNDTLVKPQILLLRPLLLDDCFSRWKKCHVGIAIHTIA